MPFKSKEQERYLQINEPEIYQDWVEKYGRFKGAESFSAEDLWKCWKCGDDYPVSQPPTKIVNDPKDPHGSKGITGAFCSNCSPIPSPSVSLEDLMMAESNFDSLKKLKKLWREEYEPIGITYEEMLEVEVMRLRDRLKMKGFDPDAKLWFSKESESFAAENRCSICSGTGHNSRTCPSHTMSICGKCGGSDFIQESYYDGQIYCQKCEVFIPTNELKTVKNPKWKEMFGAESFSAEGSNLYIKGYFPKAGKSKRYSVYEYFVGDGFRGETETKSIVDMRNEIPRIKWNLNWRDGDYSLEGTVRKVKSMYVFAPAYINGHFMYRDTDSGPIFRSKTQWDCVIEAIEYAYDYSIFKPRLKVEEQKKWWQLWKAESFNPHVVQKSIKATRFTPSSKLRTGAFRTKEEAQEYRKLLKNKGHGKFGQSLRVVKANKYDPFMETFGKNAKGEYFRDWQAESFAATTGKRMYCPACQTNRTWMTGYKKREMDYTKGERPQDFRFYVCNTCEYAYDPKTSLEIKNWKIKYYGAESFRSYKVAPDLSSYTKAELVSSIAGPQGTAAYDEVVYDPVAQSRLSAESIDSFSPARLMILGASIGVALGLYKTRGE